MTARVLDLRPRLAIAAEAKRRQLVQQIIDSVAHLKPPPLTADAYRAKYGDVLAGKFDTTERDAPKPKP